MNEWMNEWWELTDPAVLLRVSSADSELGLLGSDPVSMNKGDISSSPERTRLAGWRTFSPPGSPAQRPCSSGRVHSRCGAAQDLRASAARTDCDWLWIRRKVRINRTTLGALDANWCLTAAWWLVSLTLCRSECLSAFLQEFGDDATTCCFQFLFLLNWPVAGNGCGGCAAFTCSVLVSLFSTVFERLTVSKLETTDTLSGWLAVWLAVWLLVFTESYYRTGVLAWSVRVVEHIITSELLISRGSERSRMNEWDKMWLNRNRSRLNDQVKEEVAPPSRAGDFSVVPGNDGPNPPPAASSCYWFPAGNDATTGRESAIHDPVFLFLFLCVAYFLFQKQ